MKRVKSYLRITAMSDARLSHLCVLSIERGLSGELLIDPSSVIDGFAVGKRQVAIEGIRLNLIQKIINGPCVLFWGT